MVLINLGFYLLVLFLLFHLAAVMRLRYAKGGERHLLLWSLGFYSLGFATTAFFLFGQGNGWNRLRDFQFEIILMASILILVERMFKFRWLLPMNGDHPVENPLASDHDQHRPWN